jgi:hypothetical protein
MPFSTKAAVADAGVASAGAAAAGETSTTSGSREVL